MSEAEFIRRKSKSRMTEEDFGEACVVMCMNGIGSLEEVLDMPSDIWFDSQKSLASVLEKQNRVVEHGK